MGTESTHVPPGLYIHIPFCVSKCPYCSFYSVTDVGQMNAFLDAVCREMPMHREDFHDAFDTVYIGGGTPSLLTPRQIETLLESVRGNFDIKNDAEITLEANPADIDAEYLKSVKRAGVNRLNIGIQSFDAGILQSLGRRHTTEQAVAAIEASDGAGFGNIGIDLMYAMPGQSLELWGKTLEMATGFNIHHLSCYQLNIDPRTPMGKRLENGDIAMPDEEAQREFFLETSAILERAGYLHYEVSNFARNKSFTSRHNSKYWDHTRYLGIGAGAHSFDGRCRSWNHSSLNLYFKDIKAGIKPIASSETLNEDQLQLEALFLSLRTRKGLNMSEFDNRYSRKYWASREVILEQLKSEGLVEISGGWLKPTTAGLALADSLALLL